MTFNNIFDLLVGISTDVNKEGLGITSEALNCLICYSVHRILTTKNVHGFGMVFND